MSEATTMEIESIRVTATWDPEAKVYVAESDDLPGLIIEADNLDDIKDAAVANIPDLILQMEGKRPTDPREIDLDIVTKIAV